MSIKYPRFPRSSSPFLRIARRGVRLLLLLALVFLLSACSGPLQATPAPTLQSIYAATSPAAAPEGAVLQQCAREQPGTALFVDEIPAHALAESLGNSRIDVALRWGAPDPLAGKAFTLKDEPAAVIVNPDNPLTRLTAENLADLFSGKASWTDVGGQGEKVQPWVYPPGDDSDPILGILLGGQTLSMDAMLAPSPQAMLQAVAEDPMSIGYVPASWFERPAGFQVTPEASSVRRVELDETLQAKLSLPLIAVVRSEPQGILRALMVCAQQQK